MANKPLGSFMMVCTLLMLGLIALVPSLSVSATVIGLDYGTDWLKVAMVKPRGILETVLNRESKRKTATVMNIRNGVRTYGSEAVALGMRFPETTYSNLKSLVGKNFSHPICEKHRSVFPNTMIADTERNTIRFQQTDTTYYSNEELTAMIFAHAKSQAKIYSGVAVSGAVITVPPYFNHFERQAILDAANIADLKVFQLINDETAVAINYALGKKFPDPKYHLFYDMGAGSTIASVVYFKTGTATRFGKNRTVLEVEVKAVSYDDTLGGNNIDTRLQHYLATMFNSKNYETFKDISVYDSPRALARLLKEANRVKHILSANQESMTFVDSLFNDQDFKGKVKRTELQMLCFDILERVPQPLTDVLAKAQLSLDDIESVVLVGGGVRVPAIQAAIVKAVGEEKIARNLDGDEAAVHGAVFHAAAVSAQFRLGIEMKIKDINSKPMHVMHTSEPKASSGTSIAIDTELFNETSLLGSKKVLVFKRVTDFDLKIVYPESKGEYVEIARVEVKGLTAAMKKYKEKAIEPPVVKVQFTLSESGTLLVTGAQAVFDLNAVIKEKPSLKDSVLNFLSGNKGDTEKPVDEQSNSNEASTTKTPEHDGEKKSDKAETKTPVEVGANATNVTAEAKKSVIEKVKLEYEIKWQTILPLTQDQKKHSKSVLAAMDLEDQAREERELARNNLESYLYKCKELSWEDDTEQYATTEELTALKEAISVQSQWLDDNAETAITTELTDRYAQLKKVRSKIVFRQSQAKKRPDAIAAYKAKAEKSSNMYNVYSAAKNTDDTPLYTEAELDGFKKMIDSEQEWFDKTNSEQEKLALNVDPVLKVKDLEMRGQTFDIMLTMMSPEMRLRKAPKKTKTTVTKSTTSNDEGVEATETTASADESDSNSTEKPHIAVDETNEIAEPAEPLEDSPSREEL
ncbi:hypothetical protein BDEG_25625 [Batrachochytrium dendrobatidis JEL423]|nr:hypothetical protein BDEG_25625 [Batrachochytrium dendrobatidis JEL423]